MVKKKTAKRKALAPIRLEFKSKLTPITQKSSAQEVLESVDKDRAIKRKAVIEGVKKFSSQTGERVATLTKRVGAKKVISRKILRKAPRATVVIRQPEPHSVLGDPNRFFKDTFEEDKRSFFFQMKFDVLGGEKGNG